MREKPPARRTLWVLGVSIIAAMGGAIGITLTGLSRPDIPIWETIAAAVSVVLFGVALILARLDAARQLKRAAEDPSEALRKRITRVNNAFVEAASLMDDLRRDLEAQQTARAALVAQAEEQQRLLELNQEQAEKIRQILVGETKATIRAEGRKQWLFFALGLLGSIPIGIMINLLVPGN